MISLKNLRLIQPPSQQSRPLVLKAGEFQAGIAIDGSNGSLCANNVETWKHRDALGLRAGTAALILRKIRKRGGNG